MDFFKKQNAIQINQISKTKLPYTGGLVQKADYNAKITQMESKILGISDILRLGLVPSQSN